MFYSDQDILKLIEEKKFQIDPYNPKKIQAASIDLDLGDTFLKIKEHSLSSLKLSSRPEYMEIRADRIVIPPHAFILASTVENISLSSGIAGILEGRSSIGRMGLFIQNAGLVAPGFQGKLTLELYNANNLAIELEKGYAVCQLLLSSLSSAAMKPYQGKYQHQNNTTGSRAFEDKAMGVSADWKNLKLGKVYIGADHAGFLVKKEILDFLTTQGLTVEDLGTFSEAPVDYADYAQKVALKVKEAPENRGLLVCGSGQGVCMAANRISGIRAAICTDANQVVMARQHNDANILCLGSRISTENQRYTMLLPFFATAFEGGRHQRRVEKIDFLAC